MGLSPWGLLSGTRPLEAGGKAIGSLPHLLHVGRPFRQVGPCGVRRPGESVPHPSESAHMPLLLVPVSPGTPQCPSLSGWPTRPLCPLCGSDPPLFSAGHSPQNADVTLPAPILRTRSQRKFSREDTHISKSPCHTGPPDQSTTDTSWPYAATRYICSASEGFLLLRPLLQDRQHRCCGHALGTVLGRPGAWFQLSS